MRRLAIGLGLLSLSASTALAQTSASPRERKAASASLRGLPQCVPLTWVSAGQGRARGAITIPVGVNGRPFTLQLDTGADVSMLYGAIADQAGWTAEGARSFQAGRITIGAASVERPNVQVNREMTADDVQGTLGLDVLVGRVAVIDYPGQRFCLFAAADLPEPLRRAKKVSASLRDAKLWLPLRVGDFASDAILFDTGSSEMPLRVDKANWTKLTGLTDTKTATAHFKGRAWGKPIVFEGSPAKTSMDLGGINLGQKVVFTDPSDPASFAAWPFRTDGIIGNEPFWDGIVVLDLTARVQFGYIR